MAQLAIKGHADRGDEVIKMLELLGGNNPNHNSGKCITLIYFINNKGYIETGDPRKTLDFMVLTLEEVEALMPYKIGDKVLHEDEMYKITGVNWHRYLDKILYDAKGEKSTLLLFEPDEFKPIVNNEKFQNKLLKIYPDDKTGHIQLIPHEDYEIKEINGDFVIIKKQPKYPKTYEECCVTLGYENREISFDTHTCKFDTFFENFYKLLICRDAYCKIAGEQMGLGKPWDSTYGCGEWGYWIEYSINENKIYCQDSRILFNHLLVFPTEEMRDAFYDNFKDLIENCKELL